MINRQHGEISFECDTCGEVLDAGEREFNDAKQVFDDSGWKARRDMHEWDHFCPDCAGDENGNVLFLNAGEIGR